MKAFPVALRSSFAEAIRRLGTPVLDVQDDHLVTHHGREVPPPPDWRHAKFTSIRKANLAFIKAASCDIFLGYRPSTSQIWSISVSDASKTLDCMIEGLPTQSTLPELAAILGPPDELKPNPLGSLIDVAWWRRDNTVYRADIFRESYTCAVGSWRRYELQRLRVTALDLAPPWEEGLSILPATTSPIDAT